MTPLSQMAVPCLLIHKCLAKTSHRQKWTHLQSAVYHRYGDRDVSIWRDYLKIFDR